jgi:DNA primase
MAKVSPVSIKYMIHANLVAEGALEKPDVIGALFGQTEGLLGSELDMRELQKEGKIGRIEADLQRDSKRTLGTIKIPSALDQSETTLIAAAIETIERVGPSDAQIEIEKIEDVRGSKRDYILERAKSLMKNLQGSSSSREISDQIKDSARISGVKEYGKNKLAFGGDLENKELIVVEGRADVVNLVRAGIHNVIGMNGTRLPDEVKELSKEKDIILFLDGDRGGKLIAQNVMDNATVKYITIAPDGKEVEELTSKEILMNLRKKIPASEFFSEKSNGRSGNGYRGYRGYSRDSRNYSRNSSRDSSRNYSRDSSDNSSDREEPKEIEKIELSNEDKKKLKEMSKENEDSGKAILLDSKLEKIKEISSKSLSSSLKRIRDSVSVVIIDGSVTSSIIRACEDKGVQAIVANNFKTTDTKIQLLSL